MTQIEKNVAAEITILKSLIAQWEQDIEMMIEDDFSTSQEIAETRETLADYKAQLAVYSTPVEPTPAPVTAKVSIVEALATEFAEMDKEIAVKNVEWAKRKCVAVQEFKNSEEGKLLKKNVWAYYPRIHAIAGGKTWFEVFQYGYNDNVENFMNKNSAVTAEKRNAKIASDLQKVGITEVMEASFIRSTDGFEGVYKVMTDKGAKVVTIQVIGAGGYNIQCFHLRVLVKVK